MSELMEAKCLLEEGNQSRKAETSLYFKLNMKLAEALGETVSKVSL